MTAPFFSVIIPTYNRAQLTIEAVQSVLGQTFTALEVWIVDDAGTDDLEDRAAALQDPRIHYVRLPHNQGANAARNKGIEQAKGTWVAFLDSDDYWAPDYLEQSKKFIESLSTDKAVLYSSIQYKRPNGTIQIKPGHAKAENTDVLTYLFREDGLMQTSGLIVDAGTIKTVLFDTRLPRHNDLDLVWRLERAGIPFYYNDTRAVVWRADPRPDRISLEKNYKKSLIWYRIFAPHVSYHVRAAFRVLFLAPSIPRIRVDRHLFYILSAVFSIPPKKTCAALLRYLLPERTYEKIATRYNRQSS